MNFQQETKTKHMMKSFKKKKKSYIKHFVILQDFIIIILFIHTYMRLLDKGS